MADTTKKIADNATKGKRVSVRLPRLPGQNAIQEEFFSVNGKNYIIKRGETVEIPEEVAEVIRNGEKAEEYADLDTFDAIGELGGLLPYDHIYKGTLYIPIDPNKAAAMSDYSISAQDQKESDYQMSLKGYNEAPSINYIK